MPVLKTMLKVYLCWEACSYPKSKQSVTDPDPFKEEEVYPQNQSLLMVE